MIAKVAADLPNVSSRVRDFVYEILCQSNQLNPSCYPMTETPLLQRGTPRGVLFCLHGPRLVKLTAVWDLSDNQVVFYNAAGERYLSLPVPDCSATLL